MIVLAQVFECGAAALRFGNLSDGFAFIESLALAKAGFGPRSYSEERENADQDQRNQNHQNVWVHGRSFFPYIQCDPADGAEVAKFLRSLGSKHPRK